MTIKSFAAALFLAWSLSAMGLAETSSPSSVPSPSSEVEQEQQVRDVLQRLDRILRQRLLGIAEHGSPSVAEREVVLADVDRFRRQLRSLESRLHGWETGRGAIYLNKVDALRHLTDNLARGAQEPPGKVAALTQLHRALTVEWPPATPLKVVVEGDDCTDAIPIEDGTYFGDTSGATVDGSSSCGGSAANDVWFAYTSATSKTVVVDTFGSGFDSLLSVHTGCPGTFDNELVCNDDTIGLQSAVTFEAEAGVQYLIRVSGCCGSHGPFVLNIGPGGTIAGVVRDAATGEPIPLVELRAELDGFYYAGQAETGASGEYSLGGLLTGTYTVFTAETQGYLAEVYDNVPCTNTYCSPSSGTPIAVELGATAGNIDFDLELGGTLSGTVRGSATAAPIVNVEVTIWNSDGTPAGTAFTDTEGRYSATGLYAGAHYAATHTSDYRDELFDGLPCPGSCSSLDPTTGSPVVVRYGETTAGIDFALEELGVITGQLVESLTGFPIPNVEMLVLRADGNGQEYAYADATGFYRVGGLPAGTFFVRTNDYGQYFDQLYDGIPCEPECDPSTGAPIVVGLDTTVENIDFRLDRLGSVTGNISSRPSGEPIGSARLTAVLGDYQRDAYTSSSGNYVLEGLVPGNFAVTVRDDNYRDELYDDIDCQGGCDLAAGTPVPVQLNDLTTGIDFALDRLGTISGTVTHSPSGAPVEGVTIRIYDAGGVGVSSSDSNGAGNYFIGGLVPGTYYAAVHSSIYADEVYDNLSCIAAPCDPTAGIAIPVDLNTAREGINFEIERLGVIAGKVVDAASGLAVEYPNINVYDSNGDWLSNRGGEYNGDYTVDGLAPGSYFLVASEGGYRDELYDNLPCEELACDPTTGVPIVVDFNTLIPGIDFALDRLGSLTGTVTHAITGEPVSDARVEVYDSAGSYQGSTYVDGTGVFFYRWLRPGTYYVLAQHFDLGDELYDGIPCENLSCDPTTGTPITVELAATTAGIDFDIGPQGPCVSDATSLCLAHGRFRVQVQWEDFNHATGAGYAESLTSDSGYFWFFGPDNIELVIKVLDACYAPFNHFWIFSGGLTNIATEVTVTDMLSGEVQIYNNELGAAFEPINDTRAFATCDVGGRRDSTRARSWSVEPWRHDEPGAKTNTCTPTSTGLCLNQGRFLVEALWRTGDGNSGSGQAVQLTDDAGYFWFFSANNVEVLTKVLDACGLPSFENYWVFAAGLTDVEVTLRVTDIASGEVRDYTNPQGTPFRPIQDTESFTTCNP